jgi:hypothetical protein
MIIKKILILRRFRKILLVIRYKVLYLHLIRLNAIIRKY